MKEKEKLIMEASIKLFAQKGFSSTSIQEIADEAGISKGSFYLYFKSKEALLIAIFHYFHQRFTEELPLMKKKQLSPREILIEEIMNRFQMFLSHKEFIIMYARESALPANKEIHLIIHKTRQTLLRSLQSTLLSIYGNDIKPYIFSLSILIEGIFQAHLEILLLNQTNIQLTELAHYLIKRIDHLAFGFIQSDEEPFITNENLLYAYPCSSLDTHLPKEELLTLIDTTKLSWKHDDHIYITLEVLQEELSQERPRIPVIKGMLENLKKEEDLQDLLQAIIYLIH